MFDNEQKPELTSDELDTLDRVTDKVADEDELWAEAFEGKKETLIDADRYEAVGADKSGERDTSPDPDDEDSETAGASDDVAPAQSDADPDDPEKASDGSRSQKSDTNQGADDIWATATPEQKAALHDLKTQAEKTAQVKRSAKGRIDALKRELQELKQSQSAGSNAPDRKDAVARVYDDFPELSPLREEIEDTRGRLSKLEGREESAIEADLRSAFSDNIAEMDQQHPGYRELMRDNRQTFDQWVGDQPRHVQEAVGRNSAEIHDVAEASDVVARFKAHLTAMNGGDDGGERAGGNARDHQPTPDQRRQKQLSDAQMPRSRGARSRQGSDMPAADANEDAHWDYFMAKAKKAATNT